MNTLLENIRASAILMKNLPSTLSGDALLISREEARRIGYELEACAERMEHASPASPKVPQGVDEWIADNWWCPIHNDEECDCGTGFVPADALEHYLSGMAIVPVDALKLLEIAKCPQCDNGGAYYDNHGGVCQCQWCYEKDMALAATKEKQS